MAPTSTTTRLDRPCDDCEAHGKRTKDKKPFVPELVDENDTQRTFECPGCKKEFVQGKGAKKKGGSR